MCLKNWLGQICVSMNNHTFGIFRGVNWNSSIGELGWSPHCSSCYATPQDAHFPIGHMLEPGALRLKDTSVHFWIQWNRWLRQWIQWQQRYHGIALQLGLSLTQKICLHIRGWWATKKENFWFLLQWTACSMYGRLRARISWYGYESITIGFTRWNRSSARYRWDGDCRRYTVKSAGLR